MKYLKSDPKSIEKCVNSLKSGNIIIIPTDTVYGFSGIVGSAFDTDKKIRVIKGREETKPFIQLIGNPQKIFDYTNDVIPQKILALWPGPLTIIVHNKNDNGTTAFRCPNEPWLCKLLNELDSPIYSTSANRSGMPQIEKVELLEKEFSNEVDFIIDDGDRIGGVASTIVKIEDNQVKVLREGALKI